MTAIDHTFFETNVHCLISTFAYMEEHDFDDKKLNSEEELTNLVVYGMLFNDGIPFIAQSFKKFVESLGGVTAFRSRPMYEYSIHAVAAIFFMTMQTRCRRTSSLPSMNQTQAAKIYGDLFHIQVDNRSVEARVVRRICRSPRTNYCVDYYECNNLYQEIKPDEAKKVVSLLKEKIKTIVLIESSPTNLNDFGDHYLCKRAPSKFRKSYRHVSPRSSSSQNESQLGVTVKSESVLDELNQLIDETSWPSPKAKQEAAVASPLKQSRTSLLKKSRGNLDKSDNLQEDSSHSIDSYTRILRSDSKINNNQETPLMRSSETSSQNPQNEIDENIIACISSDITSLYTSLLAHKNGMSSASFIENISLCLARMIKLLGVNFRYQIELSPSDIIKMLPTGLFEEHSSIIKQGRCHSPVPFIAQNLNVSSSSFESRLRDSLSTNSDSLAGQDGSNGNRFYAMDN